MGRGTRIQNARKHLTDNSHRHADGSELQVRQAERALVSRVVAKLSARLDKTVETQRQNVEHQPAPESSFAMSPKDRKKEDQH